MCLELGTNPQENLEYFQKGLPMIIPISWPSLVI